MKTINKTTLFLLLTFGISFSLAGIFKLMGGSYEDRIGITVFGAIYMFIPMISVIIVKKLVHHEKLKSDLLISFKINKWFFVAWLLMPLIILSSIAVSILFPDVSYNPDMTGFLSRFEGMMTPEQMEDTRKTMENLPVNVVWILLLQGLFAGITINAVAAFGEELGWRGFLLQSFKEMSFFKASMSIGLIWGIWHAPLILMGHNYPQHPQWGVLMMVLLCILLTPLLIYITLKSKSVIAAAIMHGTMNATAGISIMLLKGGNDLTVGIAGFTGFITIAIFLIGLFVYDYFISKDKIMTNRIADYLN